MSPYKPRFMRRTNTNGMMDSICRQCFVTVATARNETDLDEPEQCHVCNPMLLKRWKEMGEGRRDEEFLNAQRYSYTFALGLV